MADICENIAFVKGKTFFFPPNIFSPAQIFFLISVKQQRNAKLALEIDFVLKLKQNKSILQYNSNLAAVDKFLFY